ncbi:sialate O-acetylesterase [Flammeovirgaceae bacterium 311]|nr:sialate O-acetylesterase [Flammeovirgaceae bacterium 311]
MSTSTLKRLLFFFLSLLLIPNVFAQLSVSPIFGSDMVLQRGTAVPVFGTASPGETVTVQFLGQSKSAVADGSGKWQVNLASMSANASPSTMTISSGSEVVSYSGIQVGEVWLVSGQSNMGWPMSKADNSAPAIADAGNHNIRLFRMTAGNGPHTTTWQISNSTTVGSFSAVGYWMGLELSQWMGNVPVGLIQATHDGTAIDQWTHTNGGTAADYEAMVKPIQPYAIKGIGWYQGESDGGNSNYDVLLTDMIGEWRSDWGLSGLPFGIVQLTGTERSKGARLSQYNVSQKVPNTYLIVTADLPGGNQLHPTTKKPVGLRAAIGARGAVYGENIPYSGPVPDGANSYASGSTVVLNWHFVGNGLITSDGSAPSTFQVAGSNGRFSSATATIVGSTIELTSSVSDPTTVRYQFGSLGNLFNSVNIPIEGGNSTLDKLPSSMFEVTLGATPSNMSPTASFSHSASELSVSFDASASADSDGTISSWAWDFGDGTTGSGEQANHTYSAYGSYTVTLTVTDDAGATGTSSQVVSLTDGGSGGGETGTSLHVQNIVTYTQSAGAGSKSGVAEVFIHDNQESPVSNATVTGTFSGTFTGTVTGQTGTDGKVVFTSNSTAKGNVTVNFCVDNVTHSSLSYDASQNDISCTAGAAGARMATDKNTVEKSVLPVHLYPNPSQDGHFSVTLPETLRSSVAALELSIYDQQGKLVHQKHLENSSSTISVDTSLQPGIYLLKIMGENSSYESRFIISQ